tara:strand:- start:8894 stop:9274 length:381 start_codon:yes stop_codon:yes gene_type:complete
MNSIEIEPFLQTPEVNFNPETGQLLISGKSYPADAIEFYQPIIEWSKEYVKNPAPQTELICEIEYLNSSSQKQLVELLLTFKPLYDRDKSFVVKWKYEEGDDDILSVGELVEHELEIPFQYEEVTF